MNTKYALALILTLQVSMSLCEIPTPSQDLIEKYDSMKQTFYKRLLNAYTKLQDAAAPHVESSDSTQAAKDYIEELQNRPAFKAFVSIVAGMAQEAVPLVDKARLAGLGLYGEYVRPYIGSYLSDNIDHIKYFLDKFLPAE